VSETLLPVISILLGLLVSAFIGYQIGLRRYQRPLQAAEKQVNELATALAVERASFEEKMTALRESQKQMEETFHALSHSALQKNNETFLKLANENLKQHQILAQASLDEKEKSIHHLIKPIQEALAKSDLQIQSLEKERKQAQGALTQQLESISHAHQDLRNETRNLVQAFRRPEVRGRWGELSLRRLVELAGMLEHCDFFEQVHQSVADDKAIRPDMIIRLPENREIVVDVKTPLDAYLSAIEAKTDEERIVAMERHRRNLRCRVKELSDKAYWSQFPKSPDFVVLFIPGEQFLAAALDIDPDLMEDALSKQVVLATPSSFIALLRTVAYGWRQVALAENAEHIRKAGEDIYRRLVTFTEHLAKLGKSLNSSVDHFNASVGSLERQVLPGARKFLEMGILPKKELELLEPIPKITRPLMATELETNSLD